MNLLFVYSYATTGLKRKGKEIVTIRKKMKSSDRCWKVKFSRISNWLKGEKI